ncbi:hypothetical protein ACIBCO_35860 [Streptomyces violascens]|uniref:hypothetical protein n=1 Tax=Streptomyces violascens TaxID=67381 RepID=UPI0037A08148
MVHHLRRRAASRKAERLLNEREAMQWERAPLVRMANDVPRVSRGWQPAPDGWALLANRARADWDHAAFEG